MSSLRTSVTVMALTACAAVAGAQQPAPAPNGPPPMARGGMPGAGRMPGMRREAPRGGIASLFLAHTGELKLSDQQVTRLAAIARHSEERHTAMRASMDSSMRANRPQPGQGGGRSLTPMARGDADQVRAAMDRARQADRSDVRDALAVLTPDQLTDAWMLRDGSRRGGMRPMGPGPRPD